VLKGFEGREGRTFFFRKKGKEKRGGSFLTRKGARRKGRLFRRGKEKGKGKVAYALSRMGGRPGKKSARPVSYSVFSKKRGEMGELIIFSARGDKLGKEEARVYIIVEKGEKLFLAEEKGWERLLLLAGGRAINCNFWRREELRT